MFIMNEGNYTRGNGSVSFFSSDSGRIYNNIFSSVNFRSPGDIPFSFLITGDTGFIVVNNSGKIEMVEISSMKSLKTTTSLISPRYILEVGHETGYISNLYSSRISIIDIRTGNLKGSIEIGMSSEMMLMTRGKVYAASWSGGNKIVVIDPDNHSVIKTIQVTKEPESMVVDKLLRLWVLCSGGYLGDDNPALICIDTHTDEIVSHHLLPQGSYPTSLRINSQSDTLFFINNGIYRMEIDAAVVPLSPVVESKGRNFYRLEPSPVKGDIFVTDAVDYQGKGFLLLYDSGGNLKGEWEAGIIPGNITTKYK